MTMKFYEDLRGLTPNPILTEDDLRKELQTEHTFVSFDRLRSYTQELLTSGKIEEVFLSYEEIENLLTEEQNQITFETYPVDTLPNGKENPYYDDTMLEFTVPYSWYLQWLEAYDTRTDEEFHLEYTWDDTLNMYLESIEEGKMIERHEIYRNSGEVFPKTCDLHLTIDDIDLLYYLVDDFCANCGDGYDYDRAYFLRQQIKQQVPEVKLW